MQVPRYTPLERAMLYGLAALGFLVVNLAFLYGLLFDPDAMQRALRNPISLAFMVEATILMVALAYLLVRWGVSRVHWAWFVVWSLLGSLAFSISVVLLWSERREHDSG